MRNFMLIPMILFLLSPLAASAQESTKCESLETKSNSEPIIEYFEYHYFDYDPEVLDAFWVKDGSILYEFSSDGSNPIEVISVFDSVEYEGSSYQEDSVLPTEKSGNIALVSLRDMYGQIIFSGEMSCISLN